MDFPYTGEFVLKNDSIVQQDLEVHGWATKELVDNIKILTLVPKVIGSWPLLRIHIPSNSKPVWSWRTFRRVAVGDASVVSELKIYGIGYKKRGQKPYMIWVLPGGHIEAGTESPLFVETIWSSKVN